MEFETRRDSPKPCKPSDRDYSPHLSAANIATRDSLQYLAAGHYSYKINITIFSLLPPSSKTAQLAEPNLAIAMEEAAARNQEPPAPKRRSDKSTKRKADSSTADSPRARGHKVTVACEECREKKRKCSGTRPRCDGCIKKGHECIYDQYTWKKGWPVR